MKRSYLFLLASVSLLSSQMLPSVAMEKEILKIKPTVTKKSFNFSQWQFKEHLDGSGGGVYVYEDLKAQQKYTVKAANHRSHLIEEITARALYQSLGFTVPAYVILGKDFDVEGDEKINLTKLLLDKSSAFKGKSELLEQNLPYIQEIIHQETLYPNHFVCYHGGVGSLGLLWLFSSIARDELFLDPHTSPRTLRLYENAFAGISTLLDQIMASTQYDYGTGAQARILSGNLSLLESLGSGGSETLSYFFENFSSRQLDEPKEIIRKFLLVALKLPKLSVDQFMSAISHHFDDVEKMGALWQLFLPKEKVDQYVYLSQAGGVLSFYKGQKKIVNPTTNQVEGPINSPVSYIETLRHCYQR